MPRLRVNIIANFVGRSSSLLLGMLFTPLYLHFLGVEAYGLIGFHLTLQGALGFLELGLSRACNRELARYSGSGPDVHQAMGDTLRSLEAVYWLVALILGCFMALAAPWIATSWLKASAIPDETLVSVLRTMALIVALRWPVGLYNGAMMGMQRHVQLNLVKCVISLLGGGGAVLVLWLVRADVLLYFRWQLITACCGLVLYAVFAWRALPGSPLAARVRLEVLRKIIGFSAGVGLNSIMGTVLRQSDKLILSAMLPLEQFGYYALASVLASVVSIAAEAVSGATFPRLSQMIGAGRSELTVSELYHLACQSVAVVIIPFALGVAVFSREVLYVYTGRADVIENAALLLSILVIAKVLHASMIVPYALQLAYGWVRLSLLINAVAILWLPAAVYLLSGMYGALGAAVAWLVVTVGYVFVGQPLMFRRLLVGQYKVWFRGALLQPGLGVAAFWAFMYWQRCLLPSGRLPLGVALACLGILSVMVAGWCAPRVREKMLRMFRRSLTRG